MFDGVCNLCNASVDFILRFEKKARFKFTSLQSETAHQLLGQFKGVEITDSVLLIENQKLYQNSTAALKIARSLRYFWVLYYLIYLPEWMRDPVYRFIARNRYSWFGKRSTCRMPGEDEKARFI